MTLKEIQILGILIAIPLIGYALYLNHFWAEPEPVITPAFCIEAKADNEITLEVQIMEAEKARKQYETELLWRLVESEAGNQSLLGKRLVVDVVLNRVDDPRFPDSIKEVIYQPGQFAVVDNGAIYTVAPSAETIQAVKLEDKKQEERTEPEILYFNCGGYPAYGEKYERVGGHYFSK